MRCNRSRQYPLSDIFIWALQHARKVARTSMNIASSRSHSVFTLAMRVKKEGSDEVLSAKLNLVDLAGSERVRFTVFHRPHTRRPRVPPVCSDSVLM
jgi:hypothetical protein